MTDIGRDLQKAHEEGFHDGYAQAMSETKIVRCKDCVKNTGYGRGIYADLIMCNDTGARHPADWFCADGIPNGGG